MNRPKSSNPYWKSAVCQSPRSPQKHSTADIKCITLVRDTKNARALLERWKANEVGLHPAHFHLV